MRCPRRQSARRLSVTEAAPDDYLDVDDGQAAVAAAELVALGYGYGKLDDVTPNIRRLVKTLSPNEDLRLLAIRALPRILDLETSELAGLWEDDDELEPGIRDLIARLTEAGDLELARINRLAGLLALDRGDVGARDLGRRHAVRWIHLHRDERLGHPARADDVDANPARRFERGTPDEALEAGVDHRDQRQHPSSGFARARRSSR